MPKHDPLTTGLFAENFSRVVTTVVEDMLDMRLIHPHQKNKMWDAIFSRHLSTALLIAVAMEKLFPHLLAPSVILAVPPQSKNNA